MMEERYEPYENLLSQLTSMQGEDETVKRFIEYTVSVQMAPTTKALIKKLDNIVNGGQELQQQRASVQRNESINQRRERQRLDPSLHDANNRLIASQAKRHSKKITTVKTNTPGTATTTASPLHVHRVPLVVWVSLISPLLMLFVGQRSR